MNSYDTPSDTTARASRFDGGQVAFIGFLYQMVGVAALQAWAVVPATSGSQTDFEPLVGMIREGELYHEWSDQDAVAISDDGDIGQLTQSGACNLIQFKFSQADKTFDLGDLKAVIDRLREGVENWPSDQPRPTGFWLITSRPISASVADLVAKEPDKRKLPSLKQKGEKHKLEVEVLQKLNIRHRVTFEMWMAKLFQLARVFGVEDTEAYEGIEQLIGDLVISSAGGIPALVARKRLYKAITGCEDPRELTRERITSTSQEQLHRYANFFEIAAPAGIPVRRELLREVEEAAASHALVFLLGNGGSGKSVLLWQLLNDVLTEDPSAPRACVDMLPVAEVRAQNRSWSWIIAEWANAQEGSSRYSEEPRRALERLRLANPGIGKPLLYLGLDGLDERIASDPRRDAIAALLEWFWREECQITERARQGSLVRPEATLIVTCRDKDEIEGAWLDIPPPSISLSDRPKYLSVREFSDNELKMAARAYMPELAHRFDLLSSVGEEYESRRLDANSPVLGAGVVGFISLGGMPNSQVAPVSAEALLALRHPIMWRALHHLPSTQYSLVLDGKHSALRALARAFVDWFIYRAKRRNLLQISDNDVRQLLHRVAEKCLAIDSAPHSFEDWSHYACDTGVVTPLLANVAWKEALSGGLITRDASRTWRWRHPFVHEFLVNPNSCEEAD